MNGEREIRVGKFFFTSNLIQKLISLNPWHHPIFNKRTLNLIYITNSPENFTTKTPTIKENSNSKFTVSNIVGHPVLSFPNPNTTLNSVLLDGGKPEMKNSITNQYKNISTWKQKFT